MVPPIVVFVVAMQPPDPALTEALVRSCSSASGSGVCVLGGPDPPAEVRARVLVSFSEDGAHAEVVRTDVTAAARTRDVQFRDADPADERFRAMGLVVAGLVQGLDEPPPSDAPPPPAGAFTPGPTWSTAGLFGVSTVRPRIGIWVGADIPLGGSLFFGRVAVAYEQTWHPDAAGLGEQREWLGVGGGLRWRLGTRGGWLAIPLEVELEHLLVSIIQPGTGRQDAGGRVLVGVGGALEGGWAFDERFGVFLAARGTLLDDATAIHVAGKPVATIPAWEATAALGLNVRIP